MKTRQRNWSPEIVLWLSAGLFAVCFRPASAGTATMPTPQPPVKVMGLPAEWQYIQEEDDAAAEKLLAPLLKKYATEKDCVALAKKLRAGRSYAMPYAGGLPTVGAIKYKGADGIERSFTFYLPARYHPGKKHGVLIFLHGAIRQPAPGGGWHEAKEYGGPVESLDFIKVGPSTFGGHEWKEDSCRQLVRASLEYLKDRYNVDENKVFIAGDSDGGRGAYALAETEATFYAGGIAIIGAPGDVRRPVNLKGLPWTAINGGKDPIFKLDLVTKSVEMMKTAGVNIDFFVDEATSHDPDLMLKHKDRVCAFAKKTQREPLPKTVEWTLEPAKDGGAPGFPANTFRWIRIEETGDGGNDHNFEEKAGPPGGPLPRICATRDGNRIEVKARKVKRFTVLVSDEMFDLGKELEVTVNGVAAHKGVVASDAKAILEEARRFNDRSLVFTNRLTLATPAGGGK